MRSQDRLTGPSRLRGTADSLGYICSDYRACPKVFTSSHCAAIETWKFDRLTNEVALNVATRERPPEPKQYRLGPSMSKSLKACKMVSPLGSISAGMQNLTDQGCVEIESPAVLCYALGVQALRPGASS